MRDADRKILEEMKISMVDNCPLCRGRNINCTCYRDFRYEQSKVVSNIPVHYRFLTYKDLTVKKLKPIILQIQNYIFNIEDNRKKGLGLYLWGTSGTAKTTLGCIVLMEALKRGMTCNFITLDYYMELVSGKLDNSQERLDIAATVDFLLIDDLGREFHDSKRYVDSHLDELVRGRGCDNLPTIITTNLSEDELAAKDFRLRSTFYEHFLPIEFKFDDFRRTKLRLGVLDENPNKEKK